MTDENKQPAEFKITKEGLLIAAIISLIILVFYFTLTVADMSVFESLDKDNSNKWRNVLWLLAGITLLLLLYLVVTNRLYEVYRKLIISYIAFIGRIEQSSQITQFIMMVIIIALAVVARELYYSCWDQWIILSARLSSLKEPLNVRNIIIGIAGAVTLAFTWQRLTIADQQKNDQIKQTEYHIKQIGSYIDKTEIESDRRLSERFDNAVKALSQELNGSSFPAHLGAISGLKSLAIDSPKHTQICLDIICSCNQWMERRGYVEGFIKEGSLTPYSYQLLNEDDRIGNINKGGGITLLQEKRSQEALRAISHILTRVSTKNPEQLQTLDFHNKMLCGISLKDIKLDRINFEKTYLVAAKLQNISLRGATLLGAKFEGASLRHTKLQGASLRHTELQGTCLCNAELQGADLYDAELQGALLINAQLQGAIMDKINLSGAILLDCNLYGVILKNIKSKNAMLNDVSDIGYIKDKKGRKKWLDDIRQYMEPYDIESFTQRIESAWQAMESKEVPDGLDIISKSSIITKDSQGMYDISKKHLNDLKKEWQKRVDEKSIGFLWDIKTSISLLSQSSNKYKNSNLVNKLELLIEELIKNN